MSHMSERHDFKSNEMDVNWHNKQVNCSLVRIYFLHLTDDLTRTKNADKVWLEREMLSAIPPAGDDRHSATLWKGYRNRSLFPRLPELTSMTLIGLVLSPVLYASFFDRLYIDIWSRNPAAELNIMPANCALALLASYSDEQTGNASVYQANNIVGCEPYTKNYILKLNSV